jgi:ABC-type cobalamin/Fe3+-siderophores transport system ATPase subunit
MTLVAEHIAVRYAGRPTRALDGVSINVPSGSLYSVLGPNGSGKSTLMRALLGVTPLESGTVRLEGKPLVDWKRSEVARVVGAVSQSESVAFPITVRELVAMGRYPHIGPLASETDVDRRAVARALDACDVADLSDRSVTTLSGGEFQRARIARALAQEPAALVLDEPTTSLDIRHQMAILELLRTSADAGMTVLVVTHDLELAAQFSDRMMLLDRGRVAAEGSPAEVLTEEVLTEVYEWPITVSSAESGEGPRVRPRRTTTPVAPLPRPPT